MLSVFAGLIAFIALWFGMWWYVDRSKLVRPQRMSVTIIGKKFSDPVYVRIETLPWRRVWEALLNLTPPRELRYKVTFCDMRGTEASVLVDRRTLDRLFVSEPALLIFRRKWKKPNNIVPITVIPRLDS